MTYPVLTVTINDEEHRVPLHQSDYVRFEEERKVSVAKMDFGVLMIVGLSYHACRRLGLVPKDMSWDDFIDSTTSHTAPDEEEGEGKGSGQDQPTG